MATYGPGIDQSQRVKSVSHIIILIIACTYICAIMFKFLTLQLVILMNQ